MIKIIKNITAFDGKHQLDFEFTFFGVDEPFFNKHRFRSEALAKAYLYRTKRHTFLRNFEYYALFVKENNPSEKQLEAIGRLMAANVYFNDNEELTLEKICDMTLKIEKHLYGALPPSNSSRYNEVFSWMNEIVKFCKNELGRK